jgi:hypothetical protein
MNYRLSAMMGAKLRDNNPAITDLNLWYNFLVLISRSYILQMAYNLNIGTLYIHSVTDIVWLLTLYYKLQKKIVC